VVIEAMPLEQIDDALLFARIIVVDGIEMLPMPLEA